ncbi:MAG TPA: FosX/FosE/FosI family fosfomycin resistance hydrolase [Spirochaetota bacterium]|nr:FosX/FosE/FosI family fosfomycin resistance hydrolase [Spirochaetota bacterium]HPV40454.1 FosX/FosE/FosI family fosfomycin resistance hydrolase [Spirochaetota bacterium]
MIQGISHITLIVKDIEKTAGLFIEIFGAKEVYSSGDVFYSRSREKFFMIGTIWLALMEGDSLKEKTYNHIAFRINEEDFTLYSEKIAEMGLEIIQDRKRIAGEGKSIYFYDYDNHLFELHTGSLDERLRNY